MKDIEVLPLRHITNNGKVHKKKMFILKDELTRETWCNTCGRAVTWVRDWEKNLIER
jgi:hypothetical protein